MATMHKKFNDVQVNQLKTEANAKWHVLISEIISDFCYGSQLRIEMQEYGGSLGPFNSAYFNFALILPISILPTSTPLVWAQDYPFTIIQQFCIVCAYFDSFLWLLLC